MWYPKCTVPKERCNARNAEGQCTLGILCKKIVEECIGCNRIDNGYCSAYINPKNKWSFGKQCPLASHLITVIKDEGKKRVGQQKQNKKINK